MATSLAKQLSRLQQRPEHDAKLCHSFLFTDSDAKQFSREQVLELALSGLQTVLTLDNRVHRDAAFLLDRQFVRRERATLTDSVQQEVNQHVEHLLALLSPHLLLTAAQQILEYLVRVWEVHTYNVTAVLRAFVPYHDHAIFARILMLLDLRDSGFDGLEKNQLEGAPLITPVLTRLCSESRKALRAVCSAATEAVRFRVVNHAAFAVFISVCTSLSTHPDGEAIFRAVMPVLHDMICGISPTSSSRPDDTNDDALDAGLDGADEQVVEGGAEALAVWRHNRDVAFREGQSAALIVLCAWCQVAQLSTRALAALLKPWLLAVHTAGQSLNDDVAHGGKGSAQERAVVVSSGTRVADTLRILALIFRTQIRALEDPAFAPVVQSVLSLPWRSWAAHVPAGCTVMFTALLRFVCRQSLSKCEAVESVPERTASFLTAAADVLPLRPCDVALVVETVAANRALHEAFCCPASRNERGGSGDTQVQLLSNVFPALQRRFGVSFDAAIVSLLREARSADVVEQSVATFLAGNTNGTAMLLSVPTASASSTGKSSSSGVVRLPLTVCLMHHLPEVRCLALRECVARSAVANLSLEWRGQSTAEGDAVRTTSAAAQNSYHHLLDTLIHATRFECDLATVGADVVAAASAWLRVLSAFVAVCEEEEEDSEKPRQPQHRRQTSLGAAEDRMFRWGVAASAALLDSLFAFAVRAISEPNHKELNLAGSAVRDLLGGCTGSGTPLRGKKHALALLQGAVYAVTVLSETALEEGRESENPALVSIAAEWSRLAQNAAALATGRDLSQNPPVGSSSSAKKATKKPSAAQQSASQNADGGSCKVDTQGASTMLHPFLDVLPFDRLPRVLEQLLRMAGAQRDNEAGAGAGALSGERRVCRRELLWITEHAVAMLSSAGGGQETTSATNAAEAAARVALARISAFFDENQAGSYPSRARAAALQRLAQAKVDGTAVPRGTAAGQQADWRCDETVQLLNSVVGDITARLVLSAPETPSAARSVVETTRMLFQLLRKLGGTVPPAPLTPRSCGVCCSALLLATSDSRDSETDVIAWARLSLTAVLAPVKLTDAEQQLSFSVEQAKVVLQLVLSMLSAGCVSSTAPSNHGLREAFLPKLQNEVVLCGGSASASSRGKGATSMFRVAMGTLVEAKVLTLTGCNSLLEVFDARGAVRGSGTITADSAGIVAGFLRTSTPFLRLALAKTYFPVAAPSATNSISSSARRNEAAQLALSSAADIISEKVVASDALWQVDEVQFFRHALSLVDRSVALAAAASGSSTVGGQDPVKTLLVLALDHPALLCRESSDGTPASAQPSLIEKSANQKPSSQHAEATIVPIYWDALHALARLFVSQQDIAETDDVMLVFRPTATQKTHQTLTSVSADKEAVADGLAKWGREHVWAKLLRLWDHHGRDAATFVATSSAGQCVFLLPWLDEANRNPQTLVPRDARDAARCKQEIEFVCEVLDCQFSPSAPNSWTVSEQQYSALPIRASVVLAFAATLSSIVMMRSSTSLLPRSFLLLPCVKFLTVVAKYIPSLRYDDDKSDEEEAASTCSGTRRVSSPKEALETLLDIFPLGTLGSLALDALAGDGDTNGGSGEVVPATPAATVFASVLEYVRVLCAAVQQNARTYSGSLRYVALRHALELTTAVVSVSDTPSGSSTSLSILSCNFVMGVLSAVAPIVGAGSGEESSANGVAIPMRNHLLHVVVLALLLRLESVENSEALHFRSAVDCCREAIVSFDIDSQMICLTGLLDVLLCPEDPAKGYTNDDAIRALAKKMLKPNKIINRQETILRLVTAVLKDDSFLQSFIDSQQRGRSRRKAAGATSAGGGAGDGDDDGGTGGGGGSSSSTLDTNCMRLLVAALAAFAQYHELNEATEGLPDFNDVEEDEDGVGANGRAEDESGTGMQKQEAKHAVVSEEKRYTMLLEVLAGNALACILAGINEPTFVECQRRLLGDHRVALQQKGVETLLDRLRQSLPAAAEQTMTDAEAEQRRRSLRDPKRKLSMMELLVLKARPLTTKRSLILLPALESICTAAMRFVSGRGPQKPHPAAATAKDSDAPLRAENDGTDGALSSTVVVGAPQSAQARRTMMHIAQVAVSCVEELVRIVASGGSVVAEAVLAQGPQLGETDAVPVHKQFGPKAKSAEVKRFVALLLQYMTWLQGAPAAAASQRGNQRSSKSNEFVVSTDSLALLGSMATALASLVQACGSVFFLEMSNDILQALSRLGLYSVSGVPSHLQGQPAARILREACLNSIIRCLPCTWIMSHPYVPSFLAVATHTQNTDDEGMSGSLSEELLRLVQSVLEPRVVVEACCTVLSGDKPMFHPATHSTHALFGCLREVLARLSKSDLAHMTFLMANDSVVAMETNRDASSNLWLSALNGLAQMPQLCSADSMNAVFDAYLTFLMKFKATQCQSLFSTLVSWAFRSSAPAVNTSGGAAGGVSKAKRSEGSDTAAATSSRRDIHRAFVFESLYRRMLETLQSVADFSFELATPPLVSLMTQWTTTATTTTNTDSAAHNDGNDEHSAPRKVAGDAKITVTLELAFDNVRLMSDAMLPLPDEPIATRQTPYFAQPAVFNSLMPVLVQQLGNVRYLADSNVSYDQRVRRSLVPALRSYCKALQSSKLWSALQRELLKQLRSPNHHVRRAVLSVFRVMYEDGGDEMAAMIMSEMLPAVVEATEDSHADVVEEARLLCNELSTITGRDVLYAMS